METAEKLITENLDVWTSTIKAKSSAGRGSSNKRELYGIRKLRELILELAVRGMLVPQDPTDEPARELLKRIATQKAQLIKDGTIKKQPKQPSVQSDEFPFPLPRGWQFERIGNLTSKLGSGSTPRGGKSAYTPSGVIFLRSQNVWNDGLKLDDTAYIPEETHEAMNNTQVLPRDVLLNITGASLGRSTIFPEDLVTANVSQHVTIIRLIETEMSEFLHLGILSPLVQKLVWGRQVGMAIEGLSKKVLEKFEFPIPPLAEQHRIVAKVDELMALCDQLEQEQESSLDTHDTLVATLLGALTTATADASQFAKAWQRIQANLDTLFTTESSIDQLKQTILQLAVMGKLVPQESNDQPASKLVKEGLAEKAKLIEEGKIKKQKALPPIKRDETPYSLPESWSWARLSDVSFFQEGPGILAKDFRDTGVPLIRISGMHGASVSLEGCNYLDEKMVDDKWSHFRLDLGDIVLSASASLGKVSKVGEETVGCIVYTGLIRFKTHRSLFEGYLVKFFESGEFVRQINKSKTGAAIKHFGPTHLMGMLIPVPPLAEQHRIVAKVDEMMALCDQLKASLATAQATQLNLADSLVEQAIA